MFSNNLKFRILIVLCAMFAVQLNASADGGTYSGYSPYSTFGVGNQAMPGTAYNRTMAGVGIASRNHRYLNCINPAAVTCRDSLAFMGDFSISESNTIYNQNGAYSANNLFNISDIMFSFPIWKTSAMMVGVMPYSSTGYGFGAIIDDPSVIGYTGNISWATTGQGSIFQVFAAYGASFFDRLSVGAQIIHYFGNIEHATNQTFSNSSYSGISQGYNLQLNGNAGKFGLQYEQPIGSKLKFCLGATYTTPALLNGYVQSYKYATGLSTTTTYSTTDTLSNDTKRVKLAGEQGIGLAFSYDDRLRVEIDYTRQDWTNTGMDTRKGFCVENSSYTVGSTFKCGVAQSFRAGFEFVPNRNDIRYYYKKWAYRGGLYYQTSGYTVDGNEVSSRGVTLGVTLPVFRWYNGVSLGVDLGQRGSIRNDLVRETYVNFSIGVNMFDIWFQKPRYD